MKMRSVRLKFTVWYVGSFLLLILVTGIISTMLFDLFAVRSIDSGLLDGIHAFADRLAMCFPQITEDQNAEFQRCFNTSIQDLFVNEFVLAQLLAFSGQDTEHPEALFRSYTLKDESLPVSSQVSRHLHDDTPLFETVHKQVLNSEIRQISLPLRVQGQQYVLQMAILLNKEAQKSLLRPSWTNRPHLFMTVFPFVLGLTILWGYIFMKQAFAPIHNIVTLAKNITAEDLSHRIEGIDSRDEIGELVDTFNDMIARLERSFQHIRQFSGDVAHELKTPLTALKGEVEVALRKERAPQEYRTILTSVLEDTDNLSQIVEDLLFLARLDARTISVTHDRVSLDEILLESYESTLKSAQNKGITLILRTLETVDITGDAGLVKRLLTNLVANAIQYTPSGGNVELAVAATENAACVTVRDTGIGIPADALPQIFDRFYRVDPSRSHATGGSGLGLAIARKIAEAHDARIEVESRVGAGTTFTVSWKR